MIHQQIKNLLFFSVEHVVSNISQYTVHPDSNFQYRKLILFFISRGSSSPVVEMLDFWGLGSSMATATTLNQKREKLKPDALETVFRHFNSSVMRLLPTPYRFLVTDGSICTFFNTPTFTSPDYYCCPGHSANGIYSPHLNAFFDMDMHTYTDVLIQPVH